MPTVDLHNTANCPLGHRCESCGTTGQGLAVKTATTALGVLCLTLCPRCAASSVAPPIGIGTAVRFVMQHCAHLGIDADEMAAAMDDEVRR
jgi:hypothetical protein